MLWTNLHYGTSYCPRLGPLNDDWMIQYLPTLIMNVMMTSPPTLCIRHLQFSHLPLFTKTPQQNTLPLQTQCSIIAWPKIPRPLFPGLSSLYTHTFLHCTEKGVTPINICFYIACKGALHTGNWLYSLRNTLMKNTKPWKKQLCRNCTANNLSYTIHFQWFDLLTNYSVYEIWH